MWQRRVLPARRGSWVRRANPTSMPESPHESLTSPQIYSALVPPYPRLAPYAGEQLAVLSRSRVGYGARVFAAPISTQQFQQCARLVLSLGTSALVPAGSSCCFFACAPCCSVGAQSVNQSGEWAERRRHGTLAPFYFLVTLLAAAAAPPPSCRQQRCAPGKASLAAPRPSATPPSSHLRLRLFSAVCVVSATSEAAAASSRPHARLLWHTRMLSCVLSSAQVPSTSQLLPACRPLNRSCPCRTFGVTMGGTIANLRCVAASSSSTPSSALSQRAKLPLPPSVIWPRLPCLAAAALVIACGVACAVTCAFASTPTAFALHEHRHH